MATLAELLRRGIVWVFYAFDPGLFPEPGDPRNQRNTDMTDKAKTGTASINEIDKALRAAQDRKKAKQAATTGESSTTTSEAATAAPTADRPAAKPKLSDEEKAAKQ